jgi:hypothetical protein
MAASLWSILRRGCWIGVVLAGLFTWMGLLLLAHELGPTPGPGVRELGRALVVSVWSGLGLLLLFLLISTFSDHDLRAGPSRLQVQLVMLSLLLAWLLLRVGATVLPPA